jgi:hypothetical protein
VDDLPEWVRELNSSSTLHPTGLERIVILVGARTDILLTQSLTAHLMWTVSLTWYVSSTRPTRSRRLCEGCARSGEKWSNDHASSTGKKGGWKEWSAEHASPMEKKRLARSGCKRSADRASPTTRGCVKSGGEWSADHASPLRKKGGSEGVVYHSSYGPNKQKHVLIVGGICFRNAWRQGQNVYTARCEMAGNFSTRMTIVFIK